MPLTFGALAQAANNQDHTLVQLRRFFEPTGMITVREEVKVDANGTASPAFQIDFLGVEGEVSGSPTWQRWDSTYARHKNVFFEHGQFRIRDTAAVVKNYTLHDFGVTVRAGRLARRVVVFPRLLDKAIWLLELDAISLLPLYTAEYDASLRLLSELEAVSLTLGQPQLTQSASSISSTAFASYRAANVAMGNPMGMLEPSGSTGEFSVFKVEVRVDPLNNQQTLELDLTDGVDEIFITETPASADIFASLPVRQRAAGPSHTIARFRDPTMSVLLFWDDGVAFQVAGRGSLVRLDEFARQIYSKALRTH
ncbi:MAG: hypothetical protein U1E73_02065 [Planctomycetota bacterium]